MKVARGMLTYTHSSMHSVKYLVSCTYWAIATYMVGTVELLYGPAVRWGEAMGEISFAFYLSGSNQTQNISSLAPAWLSRLLNQVFSGPSLCSYLPSFPSVPHLLQVTCRHVHTSLSVSYHFSNSSLALLHTKAGQRGHAHCCSACRWHRAMLQTAGDGADQPAASPDPVTETMKSPFPLLKLSYIDHSAHLEFSSLYMNQSISFINILVNKYLHMSKDLGKMKKLSLV